MSSLALFSMLLSRPWTPSHLPLLHDPPHGTLDLLRGVLGWDHGRADEGGLLGGELQLQDVLEGVASAREGCER